MKTFKHIFTLEAALIAVSSVPGLSTAAPDKTITVNNLSFNGDWQNPDCPWTGGDCTITVTVPGITMSVTDGGSHWVVSGAINTPAVSVSGFPTVGGHVPGYVFPVGSSFQINAGDFPGIPPMTVNLSGAVVDGAGHWTVSVPKS